MITDIARDLFAKIPVGASFKTCDISNNKVDANNAYHFVLAMIKAGNAERKCRGEFIKIKNPEIKKTERKLEIDEAKSRIESLKIGTVFKCTDITQKTLASKSFGAAVNDLIQKGAVERVDYRRYKRVEKSEANYVKTKTKKRFINTNCYVIYKGVIYDSFADASEKLGVPQSRLKLITASSGILDGRFIDSAKTKKDAKYYAEMFKDSKVVRSNERLGEKPRLLNDYCD